MRTWSRTLATAAALVALAAACGDDSGQVETDDGASSRSDGQTRGGADAGDDGGGESELESGTELDGASALAGLDVVITTASANRTDDYPAVDLDDCPLGEQHGLAQTVAQVADVFEGIMTDASTHAWANPDGETPGAGCWVAPYTDAGEPEGASEVHVYARVLGDGGYETHYPSDTRGRGDRWEVSDEDREAYLGGELLWFCWRDSGDLFDEDCGSHWYDETAGLAVELELYGTGEGSINAADTGEAMKLILPDLMAELASQS